MTYPKRHIRWAAGLLATGLLLATIAPAADAAHNRRYKGGGPRHGHQVVTHVPSHGSVYVVRRSSAGPAIAGFLGGLFLGATLAHAAPAGFIYHDPYCDRAFVSLEVYRTHLHHHRHARVVRVIERESGECLHSYRYHDGGWHTWDEDWDD